MPDIMPSAVIVTTGEGDLIRFPVRSPDELQQIKDSLVAEKIDAVKARLAAMRPAIEAVMSLPAYWRGAANSRDDGDPGLIRVYRIEAELRAGRTLDRIPEYAAWRTVIR